MNNKRLSISLFVEKTYAQILLSRMISFFLETIPGKKTFYTLAVESDNFKGKDFRIVIEFLHSTTRKRNKIKWLIKKVLGGASIPTYYLANNSYIISTFG